MSRISRAKMRRLAHVIVQALAAAPEVQVRTERGQLEWDIFTWIEQIMAFDDRLSQRIREKLRRMHRRVPEGSSEWQILFRKMYDEELQAIGKYRK